jgi:hypothetical protein
MMDYDGLIDLSSKVGSASAYIVRWDELQPLDKTHIEQGSTCIVEVGSSPSHKGDVAYSGPRLASLACGACQPHVATIGVPLHFHVFYILLVPVSDPSMSQNRPNYKRSSVETID